MSRDSQTDSSRTGKGVPPPASWKQPIRPVDNSLMGQKRRDQARGSRIGETRGAADTRAVGDG